MTNTISNDRCFNCARDEYVIPLIAWRFQGRDLWVCSECMPLLIHKWRQVQEQLAKVESGT